MCIWRSVLKCTKLWFQLGAHLDWGEKKSSYFENKMLMNLRLKKIIITYAMVAVLVITLNV